MDVELAVNLLSVSININFAGRAGAASWATDGGEGIGYGGLFLSDSWTPVGSAAVASSMTVLMRPVRPTGLMLFLSMTAGTIMVPQVHSIA